MARTILLIDDDADDRELFTEALRSATTQVVCYTLASAARVVQLWESQEMSLPDLIFLDVNLPDINGWTFLTELKKLSAYRHIPVIMYSTSSYTKDRETALQLGAFYFLTKPDNFLHLQSLLSVIVTTPEANLRLAIDGELQRLRGAA